MAEERKSIEEVEAEIERSQRRLLEAYFDRIRINYDERSGTERASIFQMLENVVRGTGERFNRLVAKQIRVDAGLEPKELSELLGVDRAQISRWESGATKNPYHEGYIRWLTKHGYNPYGISEED